MSTDLEGTTRQPGLPRQERAWATRARLLAAARDALASRGHDQTNLTEHILKPAGVSVGSFYNQFSDKTDLLIAVLDEAAEERFRLVFPPDPRPERAPVDDVLRAAFGRFFDSLDAEHHQWRIQLREQNNPNPRIRERVRAGNRRWTEEVTSLLRQTSTDTDDDWIARAAPMLVTFALGLAAGYLDLPDNERSRARRTIIADATRFAASGLGPTPAPTRRSPRRKPAPKART